MPKTDAQKRALRKYDAKHYTTLSYKCKLTDIDKIKEYAQRQNVTSNSMLLHKCLMYCIDNGIDIANYTPATPEPEETEE